MFPDRSSFATPLSYILQTVQLVNFTFYRCFVSRFSYGSCMFLGFTSFVLCGLHEFFITHSFCYARRCVFSLVFSLSSRRRPFTFYFPAFSYLASCCTSNCCARWEIVVLGSFLSIRSRWFAAQSAQTVFVFILFPLGFILVLNSGPVEVVWQLY